MQASLILRCEATTTRNRLELLPLPPVKRDLCSDRASVALRPFELEFNPRIFRLDCILVDQQRSILVGDNYVENQRYQDAALPQVDAVVELLDRIRAALE
jgi:hypothetical protein